MTVCESTGGYEWLLVNWLRKAEIASPEPGAFLRPGLWLREPRPILETQVLRYGQVFPDSDTPELEPEREEAGLAAQAAAVCGRVQDLNRRKGVSAAVANSTKRHIAWLDKEIAQLEEEYQEALQSNSSLAQRAALPHRAWCGTIDRCHPVAHLPATGPLGQQRTSLVGLAPWSRDSGQKRGEGK